MYVRPLRSPLGLVILSALVVLGVRSGPATRAEAVRSAAAAGSSRPGPLLLENLPEPLVPKQPQTEADRDHLEALSLFAAGRMHQRRLEYSEALRLYQRALRRDPEASTVARAIVPLAWYRLNRHAEAARYALKLERPEELSPLLLGRLADHLRDVGDWSGAAKLYQGVLAARAGAKQTAVDVGLRMEIGQIYYLIEEYGKAADCFAQVNHALEHPEEFGLDDKMEKRLLGELGLTYNLFGDCFLRADRADEATAIFEKAHQVAPNKGRLEFNLALVHAHKGKPDLALAGLEACFKERLAGEGMAPYELLAEVLEDLGKKDQLIEQLEKLHTEDPNNVPLGYFLAGQYRAAEQFEKAELLYLALIKKTPTPTGYRNLVEISRKNHRPDAVLAILGEAVAKTGTLETLGAEAQAIAADADLMRSMVEIAREKYRAEPKELNYGMRLAVALLALESKQSETAAEFLDLALKAKPDQAAELLLVWGVKLFLEERTAEAANVFQRGIDEKVLPEDDPRFYYFLAGALAMDDQIDKALASARQAAEKASAAKRAADEELAAAAKAARQALAAAREDPDKLPAAKKAADKAVVAAGKAANKKVDLVQFRSRVASVLYHAKRNDEAIKAYLQLIDDFDSNYTSAEIRDVLRDARFALSNLYVLKNDHVETEEWLEQVLDEFPTDVGASNDLGYLWADQNKHLQRALRMIQRAVDAEPDNVAYRDSLGWVFYRLGRYKKAVAELEKAAAGHEDPDPIILDHLGDAYLKLNQPENAKHAWRRAAKAFQKQQEAEKVKTVEQKIKDQSRS